MTEIAEFQLDWGVYALLELLTVHAGDFSTVLDVGSGPGEHTRFFRLFGKQAYSIDLHEDADYVGDFLTYDFPQKFDAVFCSHVLEHQRNVGLFIDKLYHVLKDDGILAIAVPNHPRQRLVDGHITSWNAGLLVYNLVLGGFDCREARVIDHKDINLVVRKRPATGSDIGSTAAWEGVANLAEYFPFPVETGGDFEVGKANWFGAYNLPPIGRPITLHLKNRYLGDVTLSCD